MTSNRLNQADFEPYLNSLFQVRLSKGEDIEAVLIGVESLPLPPFRLPWATTESAPPRTPFSLIFRFPAEMALPQRMYHISHPIIGEIPNLFIAPIGQDVHGRYYEAVFN